MSDSADRAHQGPRTACRVMRVRQLASRLGPAWALTLVVLVVDAGWMVLGGWSVSASRLGMTALALAAVLAPLAFGRCRRNLRIRTTLNCLSLLIVFQVAGLSFSYLVVSTNAPLVDAPLAAWDSALGFDWQALHGWLQNHPSVQATLGTAYNSAMAQVWFVVLFLGLSAQPERLNEFMRLFIFATLLVILASGPFPAAGTWKQYSIGQPFDLSSLSHFELLRSGQMREIPLGHTQGLVSIPSLHAAMTVFLVYTMRQTRLLLPAVFALNVEMLASTPFYGSHYLVDVLAGLALALGLIALERRRNALPGVTTKFVRAGHLEAARQ